MTTRQAVNRYAALEEHADLGEGADEPEVRRFTRSSDRIEYPVDSSNIEVAVLDERMGDRMMDAIQAAGGFGPLAD